MIGICTVAGPIDTIHRKAYPMMTIAPNKQLDLAGKSAIPIFYGISALKTKGQTLGISFKEKLPRGMESTAEIEISLFGIIAQTSFICDN
jgi:hypothetical protein